MSLRSSGLRDYETGLSGALAEVGSAFANIARPVDRHMPSRT
jgi:hypothetical protein